ncbi:MAG TPA: FAD:protein FMN transferase [Burkholderiales bacterium]|nr:FAD:protein FMN transferase [Burkholderiales bacterium]
MNRFLVLALALFVCTAQAARVDEQRPLMGTLVEVIAEGADDAVLHAAVEGAYREMGRLSDMMNHYDPKSVVTAINDAAGKDPVAVPPELMQVLELGQRMSARTQGAFDVTVGGLTGWRFRADDPRMPTTAEIAARLPRVGWRKLRLDVRAQTAYLERPGMRIDLGGIAKLYIIQAGARLLEDRGVARALVNGGGDVACFARDGVPPWRVGVRDPRAPEKLLGVLGIARGIVASSGDYERYFERDGRRYHHILDPRTGYPSTGVHGVTLVSERLEALDGLGVAIMVLGEKDGARLVEATPGLDALIAGSDGSLWMTPGMRRRLGR